jgi:hypothetical protein
MSDENKKLNLPTIKKGGDLAKQPVKKGVSTLDLSKKSSVSSILKSETSSVQSSILKEASGLDLVLVGDLTASMTEYHKLLKSKFKELCKELFGMIDNMRIGIIFYLDHDHHLPYVTRVSKLSKDIEQLYHFIESTPVSQDGNSSFDEAVEDSFNDIVNLNWREVGTRSVVLFGDAQPHEPEECPNRYNYFELTKKMFQHKIVVNSVYCGSDYDSDEMLQKLENVNVGDFSQRIYKIGHPNFFSWVANITGGMVLGVRNIEDLVDIIKASAAKDSGHLDDLEKKMKTTSPSKLKLIEVARKAEQRRRLGGDEHKMLT